MQQWVPWLLVSLFYAYVNILRNLPVITEQEIKTIFQLSDTYFGQVRGLYYIGYCAIHLPMAYLLDRFSVKIIMPLCVLLCVVGILPMALSTSQTVLLFGRIVLGIGSSGAILSVFKVIRDVYPENYFARMLGLTATIGLTAGFLGFGPLSQLFEHVGYYNAIYYLSAGGVCLAALSFILIQKRSAVINENFFKEVIELISDKKFLVICLLGGLLIGSLEGFADGWATAYISNNYDNISKAESAYSAGMILLGFGLGSPVISYFADKFNLHRQINGWCGLASALCFLLLVVAKINFPHTLWMPQLIYFIIGMTVSYQILTIYLAGKAVRPDLVGISGGGANMIIMSFGWVYHSFIGIIMDKTKEVADTTITYPLSSFVYIFLLIGIPSVFAYIVLNWTKINLSYQR